MSEPSSRNRLLRPAVLSTFEMMKNQAHAAHPFRSVVVSLLVGCAMLGAINPAYAQQSQGPLFITYGAKDGPRHGKHVVFVSGDEEYRSEEGLPMLAKILSQRHGFKCTVLFAVDPDGTINPDNQQSLAGAAALDSADAIVMLLRF